MSSVFLTGGSSPLGTRLLPELVTAGIEVIALARTEEAAIGIVAAGATVCRGDIFEPASWRASAQRCETFIHLAGIRFAPQLLEAIDQNQRIIAISSASIASQHHPLSSQLASYEEGIRARFKASVILRPTMIYGGPRDRNLRYLVTALRRLPKVPQFTGGGKIQPVHVDDVVAAIMVERPRAAHHAVLTIGGPDQVHMGELIDIIAATLDLRRTPIRIPLSRLSRLVSVAGLGRFHRVLHAIEMLAHDRTVALPDRALLGRAPISLVSGVRDALETYGLLAKGAP